MYYPKDNAQVNFSDFEKYLPNEKKVEENFKKEKKLADYYYLKMADTLNVSKENSEETINKYSLNGTYTKDSDIYYDSNYKSGFSINELPNLKSDLILNAFYDQVDVSFNYYFMNEDKIIHRMSYSGSKPSTIKEYISNFTVQGRFSIELGKRCYCPAKFDGNKSYKFKGWVPYNTAEDKSKTQEQLEASAKSLFDLDDRPGRSDFVYKAVFSETEYEEACLTYFDTEGKASYLSYSQLVDSGFIKVDSDGVLTTNYRSDKFYGHYSKIGNANTTKKVVLSLPDDKGIKTIGKFELDSLTEIVLPSSLTSISSNAFSGNNKLLEVVTNNSTNLKTIGNSAFENLSSLRKFNGLESVSSIGDAAFRNCKLLDLSNNTVCATTIGDSAFSLPSKDKKVENEQITFSENLKSIGTYAFSNRDITNVTFVDSSKNSLEIKDHAFYNTSLTNVTLPKNLNLLGGTNTNGCVFALNPLNSIASRGTKFVSSNNSLVSNNTLVLGTINSVIPNNVTSIGADAFNGIDIKKIRIPKNIKSIGSNAFDNSGITRIDFEGTYDEFVSMNYIGALSINVEQDVLICCSDKSFNASK